MTDIFTKSRRRAIMGAIGSKNTRPEIVLRRALHHLGYRYRIHVIELPGSPDIVFPSRRRVIFVHGCFWHRHSCRKGESTPDSRKSFWIKKFHQNQIRDRRDRWKLRRLGWSSLVVWECQLANGKMEKTLRRVIGFLDH